MFSFPSFDQLSCLKLFRKFASNSFCPRKKINNNISCFNSNFFPLVSHYRKDSISIRHFTSGEAGPDIEERPSLAQHSLHLGLSTVSPAEGTISASAEGCFRGQTRETTVRSSVDTAEQAFRHDCTDFWLCLAAP